MAKEKGSRPEDAGLRRRAEERLRGIPADLAAIPPDEAGRLLHELRVHQIELEMQNDELRRAQQELETSRVKYFDLYDMAPVGYITVSAKGLILEANLRFADLLGVERNRLIKQPLTRYILPKDQDVYYLHRKRLLETGARQVCELRMSRQDGSPFWTRLETDAREGEDRPSVCRTIVSDISENKRAEVALADFSKELEKRVSERTAELLTANRLMKKMLDEGKRAEERIRKSRERLRNLSGRLQAMLEEERARISREIHDELGQALTAMKIDLSLIRRGLLTDGMAEKSAKVHEIELAAARIIRTVRKIATDLRPGILDELGVIAAIKWMAGNFQSRTKIVCNVAVLGADKISDTTRATAIFRIVQEALTNVMRHAAASQVNVTVEKKGDTLVVEVRDNGIGIKEGRVFDSKSLGLIGIRERVLLLGGEAIVTGKPGEGTVVRVTLPMKEEG
jgi:PAS domain S-box-containing protein